MVGGGDGGKIAAGLIMIVVGILFGITALLDMILLIKVDSPNLAWLGF